MNKEAIILAGGLGTRLRSVVKDVPKPMADINGRPFLSYVFQLLTKFDFNRVILSVSYQWQIIQNAFGDNYQNLHLVYAVEEEPLGTGGGLKNALKLADNEELFVLNGDTFFDIDLSVLHKLHNQKKAQLSVALKKVECGLRYGSIVLDEHNRIISFAEKTKSSQVLINGGIYLINRNFFNSLAQEGQFSLEKDFLEKYHKAFTFHGFCFDDFFIDIGVPEDYQRAQNELKAQH